MAMRIESGAEWAARARTHLFSAPTVRAIIAATLALTVSCGPPPAAPAPAPSLTAAREQARQAGLPAAVDELQQAIPPTGRNAAPLYRELTALMKARPAVGDDKVALAGVGRRPLTPKQVMQLRSAFAHRSDIGALIHRAAGMPDCVFSRSWRQGAAMQFPEFAVMRSAARWLSAESALQLYDGRPIEAIRTAALLFGVADHAANDPMLIAYLVSVAIDAIAYAGMERILYAAGVRPGVADSVRRAFERGPRPKSLSFALRGEVVLPLIEVERLRSTSPAAYENDYKRLASEAGAQAPPPLSDEDRRHWDRFVDRTQAIYLSYLARLVVAADRPYIESRPVFEQVAREAESRKNDSR